MTDFNWTAPLALAGDLFVFVLGCALVILVGLVGFALLLASIAFIKNLFVMAFTSNKPKKVAEKAIEEKEAEIYDKVLKEYLKSFKE